MQTGDELTLLKFLIRKIFAKDQDKDPKWKGPRKKVKVHWDVTKNSPYSMVFHKQKVGSFFEFSCQTLSKRSGP